MKKGHHALFEWARSNGCSFDEDYWKEDTIDDDFDENDSDEDEFDEEEHIYDEEEHELDE